MVRARRGGSSLGCLVTLLIVAAAMYFAITVGEVYWRAYRFEDQMRQQVRFASNFTDDQIRARLRATADSLGLPEGAGRVIVRRTAKDITIQSAYYERVEFPGFVREVAFTPQASAPF